ncbi:hypothetical protein PO124_15580 [Bacillus licheniformis]|nr:hypothetical protein [Bacillus licheniformis]
MRTEADLRDRARQLAKSRIRRLAALVAFVALSILKRTCSRAGACDDTACGSDCRLLCAVDRVYETKRDGWTFAMTGAGIALTVATISLRCSRAS